MKRKGLLVLVLVGLLLCILPKAWALNFTEDFTTDTYKDAEATTADWNTTDGEGKLHGYTEFRVNDYTYDSQRPRLIQAFSDDSFIVVWFSHGQDGSGYGVYAKMYESDGTVKQGEFRVNDYTNSHQGLLQLIQAFSDDSFIIVWESDGQDGPSRGDHGPSHGVYAKMYESDGTVKKPEFRVNDYTYHDQRPKLIQAFSDDSFIIVWSSRGQDGSGNGVYAKMYEGDGTVKKGEFRVNDYTDNYQTPKLIQAFSDDSFIVGWYSPGQDGSGHGVYAKMYESDGTVKKAEFRVNDYTYNNQRPCLIQAFSDDSFIVVWESLYQDGSGYGVYAKMYEGDGTVKKSEFRVNDYTYKDQRPRLIQAFSDDSFIVVWESIYWGGLSWHYDVRAKMYESDGTVKKAEFRASDYTYDSQRPRLIQAFSDDSFIVVWESIYWDGLTRDYNVYAKMYESDGTVKKAEFRVNDYTSNSQYPKLIQAFSDDSFIIVWESYSQDGSSAGVYAKMYNSDGTPITPKHYYSNYGNLLQSSTISTEAVAGIALESDAVIPEGASVTYYVTNSAGTGTWDEVIPGEYHAFSDPTGKDIRWKAVLGEADDPTQTPVINSITIVGKLVPDKELEALITTIEEMDIPQQIEGSLEAKLETALDKVLIAQEDIESGDIEHAENMADAAINKINAFINQVEAQLGKKITEEDAIKLIEAAQSLITNIESLVAGL